MSRLGFVVYTIVWSGYLGMMFGTRWIARRKGRSDMWLVYGALAPVVSFIHALLLHGRDRPSQDTSSSSDRSNRWISVPKAIPWLTIPHRPYLVRSEDESRLRRELRDIFVDVVVADGARVTDERSLITELGFVLGFADYCQPNWDSFFECLGDAVPDSGYRTALVIVSADRLFQANLHAFVCSIHHLLNAADGVGRGTKGTSQLELFFLGDWPKPRPHSPPPPGPLLPTT